MCNSLTNHFQGKQVSSFMHTVSPAILLTVVKANLYQFPLSEPSFARIQSQKQRCLSSELHDFYLFIFLTFAPGT